MERNWQVWERSPFRLVVARLKWSDAFGSGYEYARENGRVRRFWTRRGAQRYADQINETTHQGNCHDR